ncbi:MAG TPA: PilZ domain-containing protein [Spirochaetota bacterium]|nr:PilZ domain-containing protein [Spirochaetota bacterium]HPJ34691.1 PilZ domain-containing protein [Spirochaetota bacterium]
MNEDKRKHKRFKINQMCEIYMGREIYIPVKGVNISEGGMSFRTEETLEINSLVEFQLALYIGDKSKTIDCQGVVRRINFDKDDYKGAIEFSNLSEENRKIIREYIKSK